MRIEHARTKAVPANSLAGTERIGAALFQRTLDFPPSPVPGSRDPASGPPSVAGFRYVSSKRPLAPIRIFFIVVDEDRKQFALEGPLGVTRPETARLQWFKRGERARSFEFGAVSRITECVVTIYTVWIIVYPSG